MYAYCHYGMGVKMERENKHAKKGKSNATQIEACMYTSIPVSYTYMTVH